MTDGGFIVKTIENAMRSRFTKISEGVPKTGIIFIDEVAVYTSCVHPFKTP